MKKLVLIKVLFIILMTGTVTGLVSCKKTPACEKENFGTVIVVNHTNQVIWVDCTPEGQDENEERMLAVNDSTEYRMAPGQVTEWAIEASQYPDGSWFTDTYYLEQCDVHRDPWTSQKSADAIKK